jgi:hypothetical protein
MSAGYIAHEDELLIDLDDCWKVKRSGRTHGKL